MATFICSSEEVKDVFVVRCNGYLDDKGGSQVRNTVENSFAKGFQKVVLNFSDSPVINSQGISHIIEIAELVVEDRQGKLAFVGLSELANSVFKTVGLLRMAEAFPDEDEALRVLL
ncbi:MAG TPA: STAS domain-containing protein [Candidatus Ozemobacteraceae bacterium]|nr:STAS domain-containing protein [Candidatus Ozemobacteraceae bacterium]